MKTDYLLRTCLLLRCGNGLMALTGRDPDHRSRGGSRTEDLERL